MGTHLDIARQSGPCNLTGRSRPRCLPGAFLAKAFVNRLPIHVHTAMLNAVVPFGGAVMVYGAFAR